MIDTTTTLIKNISSNYIRSHQERGEGNYKAELRHLLFVAQDIIELLKQWGDDVGHYDTEIDDPTAQKYAESLYYTAERIRELAAARVER